MADPATPEVENPEDPEIVKARKRQEHRQRAMLEFISTETTYVDNLKILQKIYLVPLRLVAGVTDQSPRVSAEGKKVIGASGGHIVHMDVLDEVFCNVETIVHEHAKFLDALAAITEPETNPAVADVIKKTMKRLKGLYIRYTNHFDISERTLNQAMKSNAAFAQYVSICKTDPSAKGLDLRSFLIMPIQRPPRYRLLLEDIIKHSTDGHSDLADLQEALENVKEMASAINENKRQTDNLDTLRNLKASRFAPQQSCKVEFELVALSRVFSREGHVNYVVNYKAFPYHFMLFNDILLIGVEDKKGLFDMKCFTYLKQTRIVDLLDSNGISNAFALVSCEKDVRLFTCSTPEEKTQWFNALTDAIAKTEPEIAKETKFSGKQLRFPICDIADRVQRVKKGAEFVKYRQKDGAAIRKYFFIDAKCKTLNWGDTANKPKHNASLEDVIAAKYGTTSPVFFVSSDVTPPPAYRSFSLYYKDRTLDFTMDDPDQLIDWYLALQQIFKQRGLKENFPLSELELLAHVKENIAA
eukprot:TRINITY_DN11476_c0_g1::TRINITY_DN11476_c0_g1_i1::g.10947::m.10947 TRINITY_DN11476_c0_g1::TRINITY_DN11476_c0_g1_i1::g.10947  ORF type:complete len:527 (+),score=98.12,sp/Q553D3/GXCJJ_DICDI/28.68/2e-25,RhoGEF/PF00621.15/2.4e-42,Mcp5_PH/PF12814.2/2e+02,Mcp5_PH/PF12814.2/2.4e-05,PH/PF00169.24/0.0093,PH/PF00169.24/1.1 TRINITY_DN11476_c0_g1_i1:66-1646(+)